MRRIQAISLTLDEWDGVKRLADARMKATNGHSFVVILKTRCQFCGRSPKVKTRCSMWFQTFIHHIDTILLNIETEREGISNG